MLIISRLVCRAPNSCYSKVAKKMLSDRSGTDDCPAAAFSVATAYKVWGVQNRRVGMIHVHVDDVAVT